MLMSPPPPGSVASAVVHTINEGDEDCMMMDIVELPTGSVSYTVASTREKKYKCSVCKLDRCMYLCQQCTVAFEDQQRARKHLAQHMIKGPAFPCEKCSSICLTEANLRDHLKKHAEQKLSYRCLKCTPHQIYYSEVALYYHLYVEHRIPIIAFCKSCLLASANMDRIFKHTYTRECSDRREEPRMTTVPILLRSLGFAIASELYFQPNDEAAYKKAIANKV
ncbi:unnamed protein product [Cylicostephanus goldi]|uniref:C2H2-type domain-containing protein n=1 Tax=Cylicostephanus goldi TaxID=71465 RepID=A0A3P6QSP0_CYLGO|nr:unnamed protein product [Cylicostephanus goldi]